VLANHADEQAKEVNMYTLTDGTGLIYGPYETANAARLVAYDRNFAHWEITNEDGNVIDWQ